MFEIDIIIHYHSKIVFQAKTTNGADLRDEGKAGNRRANIKKRRPNVTESAAIMFARRAKSSERVSNAIAPAAIVFAPVAIAIASLTITIAPFTIAIVSLAIKFESLAIKFESLAITIASLANAIASLAIAIARRKIGCERRKIGVGQLTKLPETRISPNKHRHFRKNHRARRVFILFNNNLDRAFCNFR